MSPPFNGHRLKARREVEGPAPVVRSGHARRVGLAAHHTPLHHHRGHKLGGQRYGGRLTDIPSHRRLKVRCEAWEIFGNFTNIHGGGCGGGPEERGLASVFRAVVNGSVKGVGAYGRGTNRPVHRMFGLARVNHDFDVVFSPPFAVGNNGPSCIGRCVFCSGEAGQKEESEQP